MRFSKFVQMDANFSQVDSFGLGDSGTRWENLKKKKIPNIIWISRWRNLEVVNVWKLSLKKAEMAVCFFIFLIDSAPNLKLRLKILKKQGCNYSKLIKRGCENCFSFRSTLLLMKWLKSLKKYYSNLTRILFSRLWLIRLSHRAENPLEKLILAVLNWPKLNFVRLFDYWANYCWCYSFESFFKNTIPRHKPQSLSVRPRWPTVRGFEFIPKNWPWTWEKKRKNE